MAYLNNKMYKLRDIIEGPKIKPQEPMAINDPKTGELVTDNDEIKRISLEHNIKILTKNKIREADMEEHVTKINNHNSIMESLDTESWELDRPTFDKVVKSIILKNKNMYKELIKSGPSFKDAIFHYMRKMISTEQIPIAFSETTLIQIWKGRNLFKYESLKLNNI